MRCFNQGSITAPIMIIGEAPGKEEVNHCVGRRGKQVGPNGSEDYHQVPVPFIGPAGRLLRRILRWANIEEGEYILTNSVSFWPTTESGRGRTPTVEEIRKDQPRVAGEISKVKPKLIITIGGVALWSILLHEDYSSPQSLKISEYVGNMLEYTDSTTTNEESEESILKIPVLPLFHTSYLLRSGDKNLSIDPRKTVAQAIVNNRDYIEDALGRPLMID